ncbi:MAG: hypothetical protein BWY09_02389 [Candidatus Hydrogenedentes bacterium ADurb.Bin179]|nr:MAG: hypothetical protein BWY09_02389 [Candidatus Hydrogenedentes bacterium ADurb.Bin179]
MPGCTGATSLLYQAYPGQLTQKVCMVFTPRARYHAKCLSAEAPAYMPGRANPSGPQLKSMQKDLMRPSGFAIPSAKKPGGVSAAGVSCPAVTLRTFIRIETASRTTLCTTREQGTQGLLVMACRP